MRLLSSLFTLCLLLGSFSAFAAPRDAFDETKVGVAARFVAIPPGEFEMGCPSKAGHLAVLNPLRRVRITRSFEMQATEFTQLQYYMIMGNWLGTMVSRDCHRTQWSYCPNRPVGNVSWLDVQGLLSILNQSQDEYDYRLPTEAEWEYAVKAGTSGSQLYYFGNDVLKSTDVAWLGANSPAQSRDVAMKTANPFGLYDTYGNMEEWVQDYCPEYFKGGSRVAGLTEILIDPINATRSEFRVVKGGNYANYYENQFYSCSNDKGREIEAYDKVGFRLVRTKRGLGPRSQGSSGPAPENSPGQFDEEF